MSHADSRRTATISSTSGDCTMGFTVSTRGVYPQVMLDVVVETLFWDRSRDDFDGAQLVDSVLQAKQVRSGREPLHELLSGLREWERCRTPTQIELSDGVEQSLQISIRSSMPGIVVVRGKAVLSFSYMSGFVSASLPIVIDQSCWEQFIEQLDKALKVM
ncbi:MAG: hypothetical protein ACI9OJ_003138 [Myxococcota bacterium]|jgi:hypothetical protein